MAKSDITNTPFTEGIKYTGSKLKLLPHIIEMINSVNGVNHILDGFSGTTRVSQALAQLGYKITSNDISNWSEVFATCYLLADRNYQFYKEIIDHLNALQPIDGWYSTYYGGEDLDKKRPFQLKNTRKLDAIRNEIDNLNLDWKDKCVILTSLIQALDKVDNTMGHYVAYLNKWSKRSFNELYLNVPMRMIQNHEHKVIRDDIFKTAIFQNYDLAYFDPPYGSNNEKMPPSRVRYSAYYHLWTTIIKNDKPILFGKANRREDTRDASNGSVFEEFRRSSNGEFIALEAIKDLILQTNAKYIMLSYSSGGRATQKQIMDTIKEQGSLVSMKIIDFKKNVMSYMCSTNKWTTNENKHCEYLFLMKKNNY
jgi:adenine-specific DNA-methyltransferase